MARSPIAVGDVFGGWTVLREVERATGGARMFLCQCACGQAGNVRATALRNGYSRSCGCSLRSHGHAPSKKPTPTYRSWAAMLTRATNPKSEYWQHYGGRGITVCDRWQGPGGFAAFLADMGERPEGRTIDRRDVDGNYEPGNCRWATHVEQVHNQRPRSPRDCEQCDKTFIPRQYHGRFCSRECRDRARWLRERKPGPTKGERKRLIREQIAERWSAGWSQRAIAEDVGIAESTVRSTLCLMRKEGWDVPRRGQREQQPQQEAA